MELHKGDIIKMKKKHPCGSFEWEILEMGSEIQLKCRGCGHQLRMQRRVAEKNIREKAKG